MFRWMSGRLQNTGLYTGMHRHVWRGLWQKLSDRHCSDTTSSRCDHVTGLCDGGCRPGWKGVDCTTACIQGVEYGANCSGTCSARMCEEGMPPVPRIQAAVRTDASQGLREKTALLHAYKGWNMELTVRVTAVPVCVREGMPPVLRIQAAVRTDASQGLREKTALLHVYKGWNMEPTVRVTAVPDV
ncbi:uncharacterized protein LOC124274451 [Haliotis rubra]|uniref:uncharacterized protein LOC124274451 n=1 Tax=Haliotis rubra TaxID=36100 RepID=UPI001EE5E633|nr:uncharacterized protein LOC124274451 [Haliotis rubra]